MSKRGLFIVSTTAGLATFGALAFVQTNPRTFTSEPRVDLSAYSYYEVSSEVVGRHNQTPLPMAESPVENVTLFLPAVYIVGDVARAPKRATPQPPQVIEPVVVPAKPMDACSPWRDMGPTNVDEGVGSGMVRVRDLC